MALTSLAPSSDMRLDMAGATVSVVCALHCLLTPLLLASVPAFATSFGDMEFLHPLFIMLALPIAIISMRSGVKVHARRMPAILVTAGLALMVSALAFEEIRWLEASITSLGSLCVLIAHLSNNRLCAMCPTCASKP